MFYTVCRSQSLVFLSFRFIFVWFAIDLFMVWHWRFDNSEVKFIVFLGWRRHDSHFFVLTVSCIYIYTSVTYLRRPAHEDYYTQEKNSKNGTWSINAYNGVEEISTKDVCMSFNQSHREIHHHFHHQPDYQHVSLLDEDLLHGEASENRSPSWSKAGWELCTFSEDCELTSTCTYYYHFRPQNNYWQHKRILTTYIKNTWTQNYTSTLL